jgi:exodeoxyribonuclease VIII
VISFDETNEAYHRNPADGSGDIRAMMESARKYRDVKDGLCERETPALLFGIASHCRLLEPHAFSTRVAVKPADMTFTNAEGKLWRAKADAAGRTIISAADAGHLARMHERMPPEVAVIFEACRKEVTVRTEIDGLAVQCRPDLWNIDAGAFYDLKTIADAGDIDGAIWSHRYHVQLRWYARVIAAETGAEPTQSNLIFVEKAPPYRWRIVDLTLDYEDLADEAIDNALAQIHARNRSGCWEDAGDLYRTVAPPPWLHAVTVGADGSINL